MLYLEIVADCRALIAEQNTQMVAADKSELRRVQRLNKSVLQCFEQSESLLV